MPFFYDQSYPAGSVRIDDEMFRSVPVGNQISAPPTESGAARRMRSAGVHARK